MEYIFNECNYESLYNIIFLCGVAFNAKNKKDKRTVLKKHIEAVSDKNKVIILEENFTFGKNSKKKLSYDSIFMKNLYDVESLAAMFSDCIFIIHESISTGTELGIFASNPALKHKICLLVPDEFTVEEKKITNFIKLAFFRDEISVDKFFFFPQRKAHKYSENKMDWITSFPQNKIGTSLSQNIMDFIYKNETKEGKVLFVRSQYAKPSHNPNYVNYYISKKNNKLIIHIDAKIVLFHLLSFLSLSEVKKAIRSEKIITEHISVIEGLYKDTLINTIKEKEPDKNISGINIIIKDSCISFRKALSFAFYTLQAIGLIAFNCVGDDSEKRKISISSQLLGECNKYQQMISKLTVSEIKGVMNGKKR